MEIHNEIITQAVWHKLYPRHTYKEAKEKIKQLDKMEIFKAYCDFCGFRINDKFIDTIEEIFEVNLSKPDMREKIREYISELDTEIDRLERDLEKQMIFNVKTTKVAITESRMKALIDVKTDLEGRLMEDV